MQTFYNHETVSKPDGSSFRSVELFMSVIGTR